jgi:hypothetical protein
MIWARMLAYITGTVDQELLLRNEYLAAENRILRAQIKSRLLLSEAEKATLAEIAHRLGRRALEELAAAAKPETRVVKNLEHVKKQWRSEVIFPCIVFFENIASKYNSGSTNELQEALE